MKFEGKYYLGLDMGTNSVGWAVTDEKYNILHISAKDMWGVREFDEAKTAVERRMHRTSRRGRQREEARVGLLKAIFSKEIEKVDRFFFQRLDNSKYFPEDKDGAVKGPNGVFDDKDFKDKDYFDRYKTIFHLRKELIENKNAPYDVRLVLLAVLNMFKHRGHFLNEGLNDDGSIISMEEAYSTFAEYAENSYEMLFPMEIAKDVENILADRTLSRTLRYEKLAGLCQVDKKDKKRTAVLKCICGLNVDARTIFDEIEADNKIDIEFAHYSEEDDQTLPDAIGEDNFDFVETMHRIYDIGSLANILKGQTFLSFARVEEYKKHHDDLMLLKDIYRTYKTREDYDRMFRSEEAGTYSSYVNSYNAEKKNINKKPVRRNMKGRSREDLYKTIKKDLKDVTDARVATIFEEIEKETFLPKQLTAGNGVIPNQVHVRELKVILKNASGYLPFLNEKDESGLTTADRIVKLFKFQIPYYIGPISEKSEKNGGNGWVVRKEAGIVLPWNLGEKIDVEKTSQRFIEKLVKTCTYMSGEKVLPKSSLLYERYCVLNEINNIRIDGERIPAELKQQIFEELFMTGKKVTRSKIENYLMNRGVIDAKEQISGIDKQINNALLSYGKMKEVLEDELKTDKGKTLAEEIIYLATIYGDARRMFRDSLKSKFGDVLSELQIKKLSGLRFKDWGTLSKEFLEMKAWDKSTGEEVSLIDALWNSNLNMMELIHSSDYTFAEVLDKKRTKLTKLLQEFTIDDLRECYFSAPVKRMIWQTLNIIKEIEQILGKAPERIFVEMTRTDEEKGDKGRKDSRSKGLMELYKKIKSETRDWKGEIEEADKDGSLKSKKLYLYYLQMGRCMYTGEPINLHSLMHDNQYDIDHIYPRHFVKDDNLSNNMVLVKKTSNAYKSDNYPLPKMSKEVYDLWKMLHQNGFINDEKYKRLTGKQAFTDEQKAGFIARQLVETGQGAKGVADLLKQLIPDTTIVYSKGRNVSDFRRDYNMLKSRSVNDFHHAQDAYLNIVVGNVYFVKFTQNPLNYMHQLEKEKKTLNYHLGKMFDYDVIRGKETAWVAESKEKGPGTIQTVKKFMAKNTPMITRMNFESHGKFSKETLYSAREANKDNYLPLKLHDPKMKDVTKYGGYKAVSGAYFFLVEHEEKGKKVKTLETMPVYLAQSIEEGKINIIEYCTNVLGLKNPRICLRRIKIQSLLKINGFWYHLSGKTGNRIILRNAVSMCLRQNWINYVHDIDKYLETKRLPESITLEDNAKLFDLLTEKHCKGIYKNRQNPISEMLKEASGKFGSMPMENQIYIISEILKLSAMGPTSGDLRLIGGAEKSGTMLFSKNVLKAKEFKIVNQTVTGFLEKEVDLLKL